MKASKSRPFLSARRSALPALGLAAWACLGMTCNDRHAGPSLPSAVLDQISLRIADPSLGTPGIYLSWTYPDSGHVSYYEIYESLRPDSLTAGLIAQPATSEAKHAVMPLPDLTRPFTVYFAVRAIWVEPTGQKLVSDTLVPDSIKVTPSLSILKPAPGSYQGGRVLSMEVQTNSDPGVILRMTYYERNGGTWTVKQDTCLPLEGCGKPIFGPSVQRDSIILEQKAETDTVPALFCVIGTESFQQQLTGLSQSLTCSRFFRVQP